MAESKYLKKTQGNGASTVLSSSITNADTAAPLASDTAFDGEGMLLLDEGQATEEFAYGTGKVGSSITILADDRGLEGGSAQAHADTATVKGVVTSGMWNNLITAVSKLIKPTDGTLQITGTATATDILDEDTMTSDSATALATQQSIKSYTDNYGNINSIYRQAIINGNFDVDQRVGPYTSGRNNDDVYTLDHWNLISDGNDVFDVSQVAVTDLPGSNYAIKLDVETAKRGGIVQFLEAKDAQKFKGKTVSISFAVKSANISAIRATVLSWASTADSITSDVVGTWADTPTWATNWADNATPADLTVTESWTTVKVEGIAIDESTVNNLALVIWTPNEETIGDIVYISQVQMNVGSVALPFMPKSYAEEEADCKRFFLELKPCVVDAVTNYQTITFPVALRRAPVLADFSGGGAGFNIQTASTTCVSFYQNARALVSSLTINVEF